MMNNYYDYYNNKSQTERRDDVRRFASFTGISHREHGNELEFLYCPYCHGGSHKDRSSFFINLNNGQFECKRASCGVKGNLITLAQDFDGFDLSKDESIYYNIKGAKNHYRKFADAHKKIEVRDPAIAYLTSRGISEDIVKQYEITTKPDADNILAFPFKDENGEIQFIKYRNLEYVKGNGHKEWCEKNCKPILFGMNHCEDFTTLVITEGQIDSLSLATAGIKNAVSVPLGKNGFTWKPHVWNWLVKFDEIVVFGDLENGKMSLAPEISAFFPKRVRIVQNEDYQGCKDANEILQNHGKEALVLAVENAKPVVNLRIQALSNVEHIDYENMPSLPTGFSALDEMIGSGFHEGELNILTGKAGEGKSTFASMIVANMLKNNVKTFCYSGELPAYVFKAWLNYQLYGKKELKTAEINCLNDWYRNKCWIYDNSSVIDENEEVFDLIADAVKSLGCKFILIDNLMTAMEDKNDMDLFRQQSQFVTKMTKFAKAFNITILLIAHPKKGDSTENDAISGSGDITNRANLVLRFQRKSKKPEDEGISKLMVTKNRTTGKLNWDGIELLYNPHNMRLTEFGQPETDFIEPVNDGFTDANDDLSEIPF